jgi:hypothetical protein
MPDYKILDAMIGGADRSKNRRSSPDQTPGVQIIVPNERKGIVITREEMERVDLILDPPTLKSPTGNPTPHGQKMGDPPLQSPKPPF